MDVPELDIDRLYADHAAEVFRFCYRLLGDRARAEDLAQDAFVVALRSRKDFRGAASPKTWLYGIALNLVRRSQRRALLERAFRPSLPTAPDPDGRLDLSRAIDALPERLRVAFVLVKVERLTSAEAGAVLGTPEGTVRARVHEAVGLLRARLALEPNPQEETSYAL